MKLHHVRSPVTHHQYPLDLPLSSVDPNLLSPPTSTPIPPSVLYSQLTPNHPVTPPQNVSIPTSTLILNKTSGNHSYASERDSVNYCLTQETSGYFLGMMSPKTFLDMFMGPIFMYLGCTVQRWTQSWSSINLAIHIPSQMTPFGSGLWNQHRAMAKRMVAGMQQEHIAESSNWCQNPEHMSIGRWCTITLCIADSLVHLSL
jgi:hypothetical protein